jgi:predicted DNA-binding transcriptional regulator AlpA
MGFCLPNKFQAALEIGKLGNYLMVDEPSRRDKPADSKNYPPRLMRAGRAAAYLDISTSNFLKLVDDGVLPSPVRLRGSVAWDRHDLDDAVERLNDENVNTVDRLLQERTKK